MADTPTNPLRALGKEKTSALTAICGVLLTALGVMSGVVWNSLSATVATHGIQLAEQQAKIAVLEAQRVAVEAILVRIEGQLDQLVRQAGVKP